MSDHTEFNLGSTTYARMEGVAMLARLTVRRVTFKPQVAESGLSWGLQYPDRIIHGSWWAAVVEVESGAALFVAIHEPPDTRWDALALQRAQEWFLARHNIFPPKASQ